MKLLNREEREAHALHVASEGTKGMFVGGLLSLSAFAYLKLRHPVRFKQFNTSIKACILIMPTVSSCAFYADQGSVRFDKLMRSSPENEKLVMDQFRAWKKMSTLEKTATAVNNNKLKIASGAWLASVGGYYAYMSQDRRITEAERVIKVRNFATSAALVVLSTVVAAIYLQKRGKVEAAEEKK